MTDLSACRLTVDLLTMPAATTISRDPTLDAHVFWFRHRREILWGIIIVVAGLLVYGGIWLYSDRREAGAAALLAKGRDASGYQQVISQYENTRAGATAYLLLADARRKDNKFAEANTTLQKFIDTHPKHELLPAARMAMAGNLQSLGRIDEALAMFQRVAADYPKSYEAPLALISQITIFKSKSQNDAARRACETVLTQYRDSIWASEAMQQLRQLKPAATPAPAPGAAGGPSLGSQGAAPPPMLARPPAPPAAAPSAAGAPTAPPAPKKP